MALTLDQLRGLADRESFRYFVDPSRPALMCGVLGLAGRYQFTMTLDLEGQFLQFRSINYLHCGAGHRHLGSVLRLLAELDYQLRFVKFGWDGQDGEIVVYGDVWLMDGGLTQQQFGRLLGNYLPALDTQYRRISQTIEAGVDPGPTRPEDLLESLPEASGLLDRLRKLLGTKAEPGSEPDLDSI
jgi:hypothetical protein